MQQRDAKEPPIPFALEGEKAFGRAEGGPNQFQTLAPIIDYDKKCFSCGYNVKGMRYGQLCPECGTHITRRDPVPDLDAAEVTPSWWFFVSGCALLAMSAGLVGMVAGYVAIGPADIASSPALRIIMSGVALVWLGGVAVISLPPPINVAGQAVGRTPRALLLSGAAVLSQTAWLGIFAAYAWLYSFPWVPVGVLLVGFLGLFAVTWQAGVVAQRTNDFDAGERIRGVGTLIITLGLCEPFFKILGDFINLLVGVSFVLLIATRILMLLSFAYLAFLLAQLGRTAGWAISNRRAAHARDRRAAERFRKERAEARRRLEESQPFGGPLP